MAELEVVEYKHGWRGWTAIRDWPLRLELPFHLAATGLGLPMQRPLQFHLIQLQIDLVAQLAECPIGNLPARLRPEFRHASRYIRSLVTESIGLAATACIAESAHGWNPNLGWPVDLDAFPPPGRGVRPDLRFAVPGGVIYAEARGRSQGRVTWDPTDEQTDRIDALTARMGATKTFMSWAWTTQARTRVDYFDPGAPSWVEEPELFEAALRAQAITAFESATEADLPIVRTQSFTTRGQWIAPPSTGFEVFVGIRDPEEMVFDLRVQSDPDSERVLERLVGPEDPVATAQVAQVGPVVTAIRYDRETELQDLLPN